MSLIEENSQYTAGKSIGELWETLETSSTAVKLVLPDSVLVPFYLPLKKSVRTAEQIERDERRFNFLCSRDAPLTGKTSIMSKLNSLIPQFQLKGKDRVIEDKFLNPYRDDPKKLELLLAMVKDRKETSKKEKAARSKRIDSFQADKPLVDFTLRQKRATERRMTIQLTKQEQLIEATQKWEQKVAVLGSDTITDVGKLQQRQTNWLTVVTALFKMSVIAKQVLNTRKLKSKDSHKWKSCLKIQKCYRRYRQRLQTERDRREMVERQLSGRSMVKKFKSSLKISEQDQQLYQARQDASNLLVRFLRDAAHGYKAMILSFIRKVRIVQRAVRKHFFINASRTDLLRRLFELSLPALSTHIDLVQRGFGHDLANVTSYDLSRLKVLLNHSPPDSLHRDLLLEMNSANFHGHLRYHSTTLEDALALFSINGRISQVHPKAMVQTFQTLIFQKRRQFVWNLESSKRVVLKIPRFDINDAKGLISGGTDPLTSYLAEVEEQQVKQQEELNLRRYLKSRKRVGIVTVSSTDDMMSRRQQVEEQRQREREQRKLVEQQHTPGELVFLMLSSITPEDLALCYMQMATTTEEMRKEARRQARKQRQIALQQKELLQQSIGYSSPGHSSQGYSSHGDRTSPISSAGLGDGYNRRISGVGILESSATIATAKTARFTLLKGPNVGSNSRGSSNRGALDSSVKSDVSGFNNSSSVTSGGPLGRRGTKAVSGGMRKMSTSFHPTVPSNPAPSRRPRNTLLASSRAF